VAQIRAIGFDLAQLLPDPTGIPESKVLRLISTCGSEIRINMTPKEVAQLRRVLDQQ
jgi:hypothetical protein